MLILSVGRALRHWAIASQKSNATHKLRHRTITSWLRDEVRAAPQMKFELHHSQSTLCVIHEVPAALQMKYELRHRWSSGCVTDEVWAASQMKYELRQRRSPNYVADEVRAASQTNCVIEEQLAHFRAAPRLEITCRWKNIPSVILSENFSA